MVYIDQFYQIVEKKTSKVSSFWKCAHTMTCCVSAICGFSAAFCFGRILQAFNHNCILYSDVVFDNSSLLNASRCKTLKDIHPIDLTLTTWGTNKDCNFVLFTPLVAMIAAVIWGIFFAFMSKGGAGYTSDALLKSWSTVYPCIVFNIVLFIIYFVSYIMYKNGMAEFCGQFKPEFGNTGCVSDIKVYTCQFHETRKLLFYDFYSNEKVTHVLYAIGLWSWFSQLLVCVVRLCCVADFDIQLVSIMIKEEEQLENVVELEKEEVTGV